MAAKGNSKDEPGGTSMNKFFSGSMTEDERSKQYARDKKKKSDADIKYLNSLRFGGMTEDEAGKQYTRDNSTARQNSARGRTRRAALKKMMSNKDKK
jgi:hypothetical protein